MMKRVVLVVVGSGLLALACSSSGGGGASSGASGSSSGASGSSGASSSSGGSSGGSSGATVSLEAACDSFAQLSCFRLAQCASATTRGTLGDGAKCQARLKPRCLTDNAAPGVALSAQDVKNCADGFLSVSCDDLLLGALPAACRKPGTLADASPCGADAQCASSACNGVGGDGCGACSARAAEGGACGEVQCAYGLDCVQGRCKKPGKLGETCDENLAPCLPTLLCNGGKCIAATASNQPCDTGNDTCDPLAGLFCDGDQNICLPSAFAKTNETCGDVDGTPTLCESGSPCPDGKCLPTAADGAACNPDADLLCAPPAQCEGGICVFPNATKCK